MKEARKPSLPLKLVVLDTLGVALAAVGFAKQFAGIDMIPAGFGFEHDGVVLMVAGVALMLPLVFHIIGAARARREAS